MLRQPYGNACRVRVTNSATAAAGRLLQRSASNFPERAMDLSDVRMDRVVRILAAIANGQYHVSSEDLAQKLIGNMLGARR